MINKRILVTGGAGFIGSNLCRTLLDCNNSVICLDNFFTGSKHNVRDLLNHPHFELLRHDVTQPYDIVCDEIYNLACPASPPHYQWDPLFTFKTSIFGSLHALENAKRWNARILQASTSEVYGDPIVHPQTESYWGNVNPIGIRSCYDEGKRGSETLFFDYHRQFNTRIKVVRIFNTYGPLMNPEDGRVVSNFIMQALRSEDISIYGTGEQTRSFCYIDDLIRGFLLFMEINDSVIGPINLGNPGEFTMLELAEMILTLTNSKSKLIFKPLPQDDPKQRKPDISLAHTHLHWKPKISLEEGLKKTITYFKEMI